MHSSWRNPGSLHLQRNKPLTCSPLLASMPQRPARFPSCFSCSFVLYARHWARREGRPLWVLSKPLFLILSLFLSLSLSRLDDLSSLELPAGIMMVATLRGRSLGALSSRLCCSPPALFSLTFHLSLSLSLALLLSLSFFRARSLKRMYKYTYTR